MDIGDQQILSKKYKCGKKNYCLEFIKHIFLSLQFLIHIKIDINNEIIEKLTLFSEIKKKNVFVYFTL